jgi:hypothetical protein
MPSILASEAKLDKWPPRSPSRRLAFTTIAIAFQRISSAVFLRFPDYPGNVRPDQPESY